MCVSCALLPALCPAGTIVYVYDPPEDALYETARVDIILETAEHLNLVHTTMEQHAHPSQHLFVCESSGWYATAIGIEGGILSLSELVETYWDEPPLANWPATAVAGVCGLDSREDAERRVVSCRCAANTQPT